MTQTPYTSKTLVILDFQYESKKVRDLADRFSLPSGNILLPATLYAFGLLHKRLTGAMLTTFYFAATDLTDELLIPKIDSEYPRDWVFQLSDVEVEKQKKTLYIAVQLLGALIEKLPFFQEIPVPENPDDILSVSLRGGSLYVVYRQTEDTRRTNHRNVSLGPF